MPHATPGESPDILVMCLSVPFVRPTVGPLPAPAYVLVPCLLRPRSRGSVRLASSDPGAPAIIDPNYLGEPDDLAVLSHNGGTAGRWRKVRVAIDGADLTDADATLTVAGNKLRRLPAATALTVNRTLTLSTTNAVRGDTIRIVREGLGAFTLAVVNGGAGAGTLFTLPVSVATWCEAYFDGTNWKRHGQGTFA